MNEIIQEEASESVEHLKVLDGKDVLIYQNFNVPIFNIIWRLATNR
jgi:hypothetical protein